MSNPANINAVTLDAPRHVTIRMSRPVKPSRVTVESIRVVDETGTDVGVRAVYPFTHQGDRCGLYSVEFDRPLNYVGKAYSLEVAGVGSCDITCGLVLDALRPPRDQPMGADYTPQATTFRVFAPTAGKVELIVADAPQGELGLSVNAMARDDGGAWSITVHKELAGKYYAYRISGPGFDARREITDIYATCTQARFARSLIVNLRSTDPPGFRDRHYQCPGDLTDAIIYELHVRDFTIHPQSGVKYKGVYLGAAEGGAHLTNDDSVATGLDHLTEMGVTHVQLMPVHDADNDETPDDPYNWGYMPAFFNSPDGWYATDRYGPVKITELKTLIDALHQRGIGVILDVVYNHTSAASTFDALSPGYYYRHRADGLLSNGSGCGNEFYSERWMARRFIVDSVRFWASEYRIDGFRFDLMGLIDLETMRYVRKALDEVRPGILVYGEPWAAGETTLFPVTDKQHIAGSGVAAFNDRFRDGIKGSPDGEDAGFVQKGDRRDAVIAGLRGGVDTWSSSPLDCLNYFESHDNLTAWDKLLKSAPQADESDRRRMARLAALLLFTSQGGVLIHAGQEFLRTKGGHHNTYNLPDEINRLDWTRKKTYAAEVAYYRGLIALRKAHPAFRLRSGDEIRKRVTFLDAPADGCLAYHIDAAGVENESASRILVLANGSSDTKTFALPEGRWMVHADAERVDIEPIGEMSESVEVNANSGYVLIAR